MRQSRWSDNLRIIATFNPRDRIALEMDDALIRRLRIIDCPPDPGQLREMLSDSNLTDQVKDRLAVIFEKCEEFCKSEGRPEDYSRLMPFGHGIFADIEDESPDLNELWKQRIEYLLTPPGRQRHPFFDVISKAYPWHESEDYVLPRRLRNLWLNRPALSAGSAGQWTSKPFGYVSDRRAR